MFPSEPIQHEHIAICIFFNQNSHNFGGDINLLSNLLVQNKVMLHIKLEGIIHTTAWKQIFCSNTPSTPENGVKRSKHFFLYLKVVRLHIKSVWSIGHHGSTSSIGTHTLTPEVG